MNTLSKLLTDSRALATVALCALATGCAAEVDTATDDVQVQEAALRCTPEVPAALAVPEGHRFAFAFDAQGDQVYVCRASGSGYAWVFQAPDADLFKANGGIAGSHYAGPTWEYLDGSRVVGARVSGVTIDPASVPWLLLSAASHEGEGRMERVSFIQRVDTVGGLAPAAGCDAEHAGAVQGVPYTATYNFYVPGHGEPQAPACQR